MPGLAPQTGEVLRTLAAVASMSLAIALTGCGSQSEPEPPGPVAGVKTTPSAEPVTCDGDADGGSFIGEAPKFWDARAVLGRRVGVATEEARKHDCRLRAFPTPEGSGATDRASPGNAIDVLQRDGVVVEILRLHQVD